MNSIRRNGLMVVVTIAAGLVSLLVVSEATHTIIGGDPAAYRERVEAIVSGGVPYVDVPFEHLPMMLVPMLAAWFLGGAGSQSDYVFVYAILQMITLAGTLIAMGGLGRRLGCQRADSRWMAVAIPLVPLVIFRNDPFVTLLFVLSALALTTLHPGWVPLGVAGALAKVWPAALALWGIKTGRSLGSALVAGSGFLAVAWTFLPGFTSARQGFGIHAETLMGSIVGLHRTITGAESGVVVTTAAYLPAEVWVLLANAVIGVGIVGVGAVAISRATDDRSAFLALGTAIAGVILASQLFSLQYLFWLTPFVAISKRSRTFVAAVLAGLLTTGLAWNWDPAVFESPAFYALISLRNAIVLILAWWLTTEAIETGVHTRSKLEDVEVMPG